MARVFAMKGGFRMTDQQKTLCMESMRQFGFGPDAMKQTKVCRVCSSTCAATEMYCHACDAILPKETLYDQYKAHHLSCPKCDTVVASTFLFCPKCGNHLRRKNNI